MPGAPNKPPESAPPPAPSVTKERPEEHALRRLAPSRVALRLPGWRGAPSPDLTGPLLEAEGLFAAGDFAGADGALDRLSVRFAEPRWVSLPEPFRALRVSIPAPQPPQWDPEHALAPEEKEARQFDRYADRQLELAAASLDFESGLKTPVDDLRPLLESARAARLAGDTGAPFWQPIDRIWQAVRERVPLPAGRAAAPVPPAPPAPTAGAADVP
ncbi:MAG: hypothetical protein ACREC5_04940 [Thermoplasmata archaeon]